MVLSIQHVRVWIVLSSWLENPYSDKSFHRDGISFTVHKDKIEAENRAIQEADFCLLESQIGVGRKCVLLEIEIPEDKFVHEYPMRWVSERITELARRANLANQDNLNLLIAHAFNINETSTNYKLAFLQAYSCACRNVNNNIANIIKDIISLPLENILLNKESLLKKINLD